MTSILRTCSKILGIFSAVMMLVGFAMTGLAHAETTTSVGEAAPNFTLMDQDGVKHSLSDYKGSVVVLEWTNHECPYVKKHYDTGNMQALQKTATDNDVIWLSVVSSGKGMQGHTTGAQAKAVIKDVGSHETARLLDESGEVGHLYGARTTPHMFVVNQDGVLAYAGALDDNPSAQNDTVKGAKNYVSAALNSLAEGVMPTAPITMPYGCSVKYAK